MGEFWQLRNLNNVHLLIIQKLVQYVPLKLSNIQFDEKFQFLLVIPVEFLRWLIIILTGGASACFVATNLKSYMEGSDLFFFLFFVFVLHLYAVSAANMKIFPPTNGGDRGRGYQTLESPGPSGTLFNKITDFFFQVRYTQ